MTARNPGPTTCKSRRRWSRWSYLVLLGVLAAAGAGWSVRPRVTSARIGFREPTLLGTTDPRTMISFSLVLRLPRQDRLRRFLHELDDPASPGYHRFIDARAFGQRFGASGAVLDSATAQLARDAIQVTARYPQRTALDVRTTAGTLDKVFGVQLMNYRSTDGRRFHAPIGRAIVPRDLRAAVSAVAGLDGGNVEANDASSIRVFAPANSRVAYDIDPLSRRHITGQGVRVAVISFSEYRQADLDGFDQQYGLPPLTVRNVPVAGGATNSGASAVAESNLDLEVVHEIAPHAQLFDYNAPNATASGADTFGAVVDRIVADGQANIVSDSWGSCEATTPQADIRRDEQAIEAAVARGISIFTASGDTGAYTCQQDSAGDHRLSVSWPASSPSVISVGGTSLSVAASSAYQRETAWEDTLEQAGGGGGLSLDYARPSWQVGPGVDNQFADDKRQLPDVSANADPWSGWAIYTGGALQAAGGTSAATPFWAAATALIAQYAHQHGVGRLGFVDPMLYAIAASRQQAPGFHDVTVGANRYYPATPGWDFATGLGSPDVYNLAQDVVAYMKRQT